MRPGLEKMFNDETEELFDKNTTLADRITKWTGLVQLQEGCIRTFEDRSIVSNVDPKDVTEAKGYLERLKRIRLSL
jgi:hypothetical protein